MQDQRHEWAYFFGAAGPGGEAAFALLLPTVNTDTMQIFLDRFAETLAEDEHAVMVLDGAGWHGAKALAVPPNVTLAHLPPYSPQVNHMERVWLDLRERTFVIDVFARRIVGWRVSTSMTTGFVLDALNQAICQRTPSDADALIHHSDRGSQYLSIKYTELVPENQTASQGVFLGKERDTGPPRRSALPASAVGGRERPVGSPCQPHRSSRDVQGSDPWELLLCTPGGSSTADVFACRYALDCAKAGRTLASVRPSATTGEPREVSSSQGRSGSVHGEQCLSLTTLCREYYTNALNMRRRLEAAGVASAFDKAEAGATFYRRDELPADLWKLTFS